MHPPASKASKSQSIAAACCLLLLYWMILRTPQMGDHGIMKKRQGGSSWQHEEIRIIKWHEEACGVSHCMNSFLTLGLIAVVRLNLG